MYGGGSSRNSDSLRSTYSYKTSRTRPASGHRRFLAIFSSRLLRSDSLRSLIKSSLGIGYRADAAKHVIHIQRRSHSDNVRHVQPL